MEIFISMNVRTGGVSHECIIYRRILYVPSTRTGGCILIKDMSGIIVFQYHGE